MYIRNKNGRNNTSFILVNSTFSFSTLYRERFIRDIFCFSNNNNNNNN